MNIGIVLAGGVGRRFGSDLPKQYQTINGHEVLFYAINALKKSISIDKIVVVAQDEYADGIKKSYLDIEVVEGGNTRNVSLYNALDFIKNNYCCDKVIILEAARPMITSQIVDDYIQRLDRADAVITGQKIVASLGSYTMHVVDRENYYLIEAPEAFRFDLLCNNFDKDSKTITATNQHLPPDSKLDINFDFANNVKITYPSDLKYCERLMNENEI